MSFQSRTPESLVQRSDSKNPATTCRGITTSGKPCRRALASLRSSPAASRRSTSCGVVAVVENDQGHTGAAAFYCYQHKDQAQNLAQEIANPRRPARSNTKIISLQGRNSIDSLVDRLGVATIQDESTPTRKPRKDSRPATSHSAQSRPPPHPPRREPQRGFWASLCCASSADQDDDYLEVVRHKHRTSVPKPVPETTQVANAPPLAYPAPTRPPSSRQDGSLIPNRQTQHAASIPGLPMRKPLSNLSAPALNSRRAASAPGSTSNLLSFIPPHLSPQATSALLSELSKPISPHDEAGYIYIFWLTETSTAPPSSTAASLLSPTPHAPRRLSDVTSQYTAGQKTLKLKIGRANNVQRRMNEWTRQCGHDTTLVRFYPYVSDPSPLPLPSPSSPSSPSPPRSRPPPERTVSDQVRKVPHAHRVERLVHLELADKRVKRDCAACGREHREWFEIEATREGVGAVDEVVRRWVRWAERAPTQ